MHLREYVPCDTCAKKCVSRNTCAKDSIFCEKDTCAKESIFSQERHKFKKVLHDRHIHHREYDS